jgi:PAP2 superfamily
MFLQTESQIDAQTGNSGKCAIALPGFERLVTAIVTGFILAAFALLPKGPSLTVALVVQWMAASILPLVYAVLAHLSVAWLRTGSFDTALSVVRHSMTRDAIWRALRLTCLFAAFILTFPTWKSQIPHFNPYVWDETIAALDRAIHFGAQPWEVLNRVTGYGLITTILDKIYYLWFPAIFMALGAAALSAESRVSQRFLISFALSWIIIGVALAIAFSSVGPIFLDRLTGTPSEFATLAGKLEAVDAAYGLRTIEVRDQLWDSYLGMDTGIVSGISAMPSMHNAICVLIFLAARHIHRVVAIAAGLFALVIFTGSVHLGWHYAVDGYASAALVPIIWKLSEKLVHLVSRS